MEIKELKGVIASLVLRKVVKAKCFTDVDVNHRKLSALTPLTPITPISTLFIPYYQSSDGE